jgi:hypothetical protein
VKLLNCYKEGGNTLDLKEKLTNHDEKNYKYKHIAPANGLYLWKINHLK